MEEVNTCKKSLEGRSHRACREPSGISVIRGSPSGRVRVRAGDERSHRRGLGTLRLWRPHGSPVRKTARQRRVHGNRDGKGPVVGPDTRSQA